MKWTSFVLCGLFSTATAYLPNIGDIVPEKISKIVPDVVPEVLSEINPLKVLYFNSCIEDLGCFYTGPPFYHPLVRPISLCPADPTDTVKFQLYTPSNPKESYDLRADEESLRNSTFNPDLPTKILIHGFRSDLDINDIRHDIRTAFLKQGQYNIIIVDWTKINGFPYAQAAANTRTVGAKAAQLIHFLMNNTDMKAEDIHIIGHSLGGQTAGYIGERVPNIGRITGLDPAGPFFQGMDESVRLDTSDAHFVDIIHSDGGEYVLNGLGTSDAVGHIDFFPNGGRRQPGCFYASESDNVVGAAVNYTTKFLSNGCDHGRANEYFLETIDNSKCKFMAVQCSNYKDFEKGLCPPENATIAEMGFHVQRIPNLGKPAKFFLRTNDTSPYCIQDSISL